MFLARDARGTLEVTREGANVWLTRRLRGEAARTAAVAMRFPGADWSRVRGEGKRVSYTTFFLGNEPARRADHFEQVRIAGIYPGMDVVFHARRGMAEFDFELQPGVNPARARFSFPGYRPRLLANGDLRIDTPAGDLTLPRPVAWQPGQRMVSVEFRVAGSEVSFALGGYDRRQALTIDPALTYVTYLGGNNTETPAGMAVDAAGNLYLAGSSGSSNFTVTNGVLQAAAGGNLDAFISKFSPSGVLVYSTLLGGRDRDLINDIAVDAQGSVYFCGSSASTNFPLRNPIQADNKGGGTGLDAIFGKLNPTGTGLVYATFYGGNYTDRANACTIDAEGSLYVTGYTVSDNFPFTQGAFQTSNRSPIAGNGFVTKIAPAGDRAVFTTYVGGNTDDELYAIAVDRNRNVFVAGTSASSNYPVAGAFQSTNRGRLDAVLTKLNPTGTAILFSTFFGGGGTEVGYSVNIDAEDNIFLTGVTASTDFRTTANAIKKELQGPTDTFIAKFNSVATDLLASTLFGGNREDEPFRTAMDRTGSLYVVGTTASPGITAVEAVQTQNGGGRDAYLLKLNNALDRVQMFTYFGGPSDDLGFSMAVDSTGRVAIAGSALSTSLATTPNAAQKTHGGGNTDGFLAIIDSSPAANPFTISTTRLSFTGTSGATMARQQFTIRAAAGAPEWTIEATTTSGGNWLSATPRTGTGNATIDVGVNTANLAAGSYEGTLAVSNTRLGTRTLIPVALTLTPAGGTVPDNGVVSAATFQGGAVSPGLLVTVFGMGLGPAQLTTAQVSPAGVLASTLAETRVLFDGVAAPLVYVAATQLSAIVPYGVAGKATTSMQVEYRGVRSNAVTLRVAETQPGLFTANSSGKGPGAILNEDNSLNTGQNPAAPGSIVILYGTGEGVTDPAGQDGQLALSGYPKPRQPVTVRIGGKEAEVLYAGAAPGLVAGVFQINVKVPEGLDGGAQPVVVQIGAASSSPEVTVAVRP
ncbi:MAG: SBBP repeat-containing protein [Acidobacteriota bacterium]